MQYNKKDNYKNYKNVKNKREFKPDYRKKKPEQEKYKNQAAPDDICWGRQPVLDLIRDNPSKCARLLIANNVRPPFLDELTDLARAGRVVYQLVAPEALEKLCAGEHHQGVACRLNYAKPVELDEFLKALSPDEPNLFIVTDHIEDPHNLGAIARSAEAAGAAAVIYSKRHSAIPGGTVIKTSAGAALRIPMITVMNITRTLEQLKAADFWCIGLDANAKDDLFEYDFPDKTALVIGSEGDGLSRLVRETCDNLLKIQIKGKTDSLNASVAAALGMFEWRRKFKF